MTLKPSLAVIAALSTTVPPSLPWPEGFHAVGDWYQWSVLTKPQPPASSSKSWALMKAPFRAEMSMWVQSSSF
ncbi:hypothetical protein [Ideonella azotifigens]|uniref:hypothetical protein n=1 Tax=Ideonella azotifigens TaxID=513160 RepID=UPI0011424D2B|nr:hypothetical protein [Ideonella azotifigens]